MSFILLIAALSACSAGTWEKRAEGVSETENLKVELVENSCVLNTLVLKFKVTAKKLDSLMIEDEPLAEHFSRYVFGTDVFTVDMGFGKCTGISRDIYSDEDSSLEPNQFYVYKLFVDDDEITSGDYFFRFSGFGSYTKENEGKIKVLYDDVLDVPVKITNDADSGRNFEPDIKYNIGGEEFLLSRAMVTPYAIMLNFSGESNNANTDKFNLEELRVNLQDKTVLIPTVNPEERKDLDVALISSVMIGKEWEGSLALMFYDAVDIDSIAGITVGGNLIELGAKS